MFKCFKKKEQDRPSLSQGGGKFLRCPLAIQDYRNIQMKSRGKYKNGYPQGAIVHFTAGSSAESSLEWGVKSGFLFFVIARDGRIFQNFDLNTHGYHAGKSYWPHLGSSVSSKLVGIEMAAAGRLEKHSDGWYSYFGKKIEHIRTVSQKRYTQETTGTYEAFQTAQEQSLLNLLIWLKRNNPEVFNCDYILGHDEVSPGRKNDPGGALSMGMPNLRKQINDFVST